MAVLKKTNFAGTRAKDNIGLRGVISLEGNLLFRQHGYSACASLYEDLKKHNLLTRELKMHDNDGNSEKMDWQTSLYC